MRIDASASRCSGRQMEGWHVSTAHEHAELTVSKCHRGPLSSSSVLQPPEVAVWDSCYLQ